MIPTIAISIPFLSPSLRRRGRNENNATLPTDAAALKHSIPPANFTLTDLEELDIDQRDFLAVVKDLIENPEGFDIDIPAALSVNGGDSKVDESGSNDFKLFNEVIESDMEDKVNN